MKFQIKDSKAKLDATSLVVLFACEGAPIALPNGVQLPASASDDFKGRFRQLRLADATKGPAERVLLVGLGKKKDADWERQRRAAAVAIKRAEGLEHTKVTFWISKDVNEVGCGAEGTGLAIAEGAGMGAYHYEQLKTKPKKRKLSTVVLQGSGSDFKKGAQRGIALAEGNAFARDLQNGPGNVITPTAMASAAKKIAASSPTVTAKILDEAAMKKLGMGALLGVSAGSRQPAKLIHLTYKPAKASRGKKKIALVGKGLTFDAGGISLKPSPKMDEMKYDMSGGAAVLGTFHALAKLGCKHEVHGVVPASENLPDGLATKPGDVHTAMNGKTIEVLNTDAEGRLILADALCYVGSKIKPDTVIDLATLTGAVVVALGHELSGMFPTTEDLAARLTAAGQATGELVWPLPLEDFHKEQMKGRVADLKNINTPGTGNGSTTGAAFLSNFVGDLEWCHLDIAGTAWGARNRDYSGGPLGTGVGVRLLMEYLAKR